MLDRGGAYIVCDAKERKNAHVLFVFLDWCCGRYCNLKRPPCDGPGGQELPDGAAVPLEGFQEILRLGKGLPLVGKLSVVFDRHHTKRQSGQHQSRDKFGQSCAGVIRQSVR